MWRCTCPMYCQSGQCYHVCLVSRAENDNEERTSPAMVSEIASPVSGTLSTKSSRSSAEVPPWQAARHSSTSNHQDTSAKIVQGRKRHDNGGRPTRFKKFKALQVHGGPSTPTDVDGLKATASSSSNNGMVTTENFFNFLVEVGNSEIQHF
ncbi:hypothetical protein FOZ62_005277 [Perkinsus olseni]|uniref:Uncharacterized protein n=1 Tax=Perkinsus olseni TaxID=32597 RepID=A0A7J6RQ55_PEROL|nr:hypothetical protein FOZ62_005277 [Perkinsus olseni]